MIRCRLVLALFVSLVLLTSTGCLGRMVVTSNVTKFNVNAVESRWGREVLFLAMYFVPVYPIAGLVDLCVVNAVEFWNGENPLNGESALVDQ